jgi:hypothetical protein
MHLHYLLLLLTLLTLLLPLTTTFPLTSTSLSTPTTRSLTLQAPPACPRYRKRHGGHLRYRLSRLRTACRPQPQLRPTEREAFDGARTRTATFPADERRALPSAGRVLEGAAVAADL